MATPAQLFELRCPDCNKTHWEIDNAYRGMDGKKTQFSKCPYFCPHCDYSREGYVVLQESPPHFLLQPHPIFPMTKQDFGYWVDILEREFPSHPRLKELGRSFVPMTPEEAYARSPNIVRVTDETGSAQHYPQLDREASILFEFMDEPGNALTFVHKDGRELSVILTDDGKFETRTRETATSDEEIQSDLARTEAWAMIERFYESRR